MGPCRGEYDAFGERQRRSYTQTASREGRRSLQFQLRWDSLIMNALVAWLARTDPSSWIIAAATVVTGVATWRIAGWTEITHRMVHIESRWRQIGAVHEFQSLFEFLALEAQRVSGAKDSATRKAAGQDIRGALEVVERTLDRVHMNSGATSVHGAVATIRGSIETTRRLILPASTEGADQDAFTDLILAFVGVVRDVGIVAGMPDFLLKHRRIAPTNVRSEDALHSPLPGSGEA